MRSPVDGQVGQVQVADRASVAKDAPLLTVVDLSALEVEIKVTESLARDLRPGMTRGSRGRRSSLAGHRERCVARGRRRAGHGPTALRRRKAGGPAPEPAAVGSNFHRSARQRADGRSRRLHGSGRRRICLLVHGNVAERHPVHLGAASIAKVEILDGLAVGDQIVISGTDAFNGAERVILSH